MNEGEKKAEIEGRGGPPREYIPYERWYVQRLLLAYVQGPCIHIHSLVSFLDEEACCYCVYNVSEKSLDKT